MTRRQLPDVRHANHKAGFYFFAEDALKFFDGKIAEDQWVYGEGPWFFVSSERFSMPGMKFPRLYTTRRQNINGSISTIGEFQEHSSFEEARAAAERAALESEARFDKEEA